MKRKIIGFTLLFVGLVLISYAVAAKYVTYRRQQQMINSFEKDIKNVNENSINDNTANNNSDNNTANNNTINNSDSSKDNSSDVISGVVGVMEIPKINLKAAIGEGVDMETLKCALGHFPGTAEPGEKGNFCVAGHRSYTYSEYFNRLNEVANGDEITVEAKKGTYKYKVYDIKVVLPSEVSVLNTSEDATLTLVTCTPPRIATHRLIVKAKLEN
ncbi:MAG: class D sortase [Bacillota bacterium]|nr:class D sortase [Bacillota bacterium]